LAINPAARFIHLSYSDDLALDNSEEVRDIVSSAEYKELFPGIEIKRDSNSKKKWYTSAGGGVYATAAGGQVTGFGAGRVDDEDLDFINESNGFAGALIIDDPIKPDDADSETIRERINQRFDSTIRNRVNSRKTPIIIIMQRLHERDLCGYLLEQEPDDWTVLSLPSIKKDGTALWPFKHTIEELRKLEAQNETVFERQHMQEPKPLKGLMFPSGELRYFTPDPLLKFESSIGYVDVADEGNDFLSAPIGKTIGKDIYITDVVYSKANTELTLPMVTAMLKRNEAKYARVESNSMGAMYHRELVKLNTTCKILTACSTTNKHTRIIMDAAFIKQNCLFIHPDFQSEEYKAFMKNLTSYLKEKIVPHDDAADSMSGLVMFIRGILRHVYSG
jgi:predicted phage terminase large subunit-like protein